MFLDHNTYNMKWKFIKKYNCRVYEGSIHFKITLKKKEKRVNEIHTYIYIYISRTQRNSIIKKRRENKEELAKDRTWNLLEFLTVNIFNLKKKKGGYRAKLNVFNLKKNER